MNVSSAAPATPALTRTVAGVAACIALLAVAALPFRSVAIGLVPGFYTLYGTALVASYALTAFLLAWWSKRSGDGTVILSATYFFAAAMVAGNVIALVEPTDRAQNLQAGAWLWSIWHLAFPFGILLSKDSRLAGRISLTAGLLSALGAVVAALFLLPFGSRSIALLSASGHVTPALYAVGVLAAGLAVLALRRLVARKRKTALDVVLALALVTLVADVGLSLSSTVGFSIGTYAARLMGLLSGLIVVVTLLRWVIAAAERSGALAQYVTIAEDAPNVMYLFDEDTESLYVNSRWTELTGQTPAQAHGLGWREQIHPEDLRRRFETGRNWYRGARNELRIRARDGSFVWHLVQYAAARDRSGRQFGWVGSAINLDREHRALEENRGLIERLRRQYESEHEIATTLRAAFLPNFLPEVDGIGFAAVYRPIRSTDQVGGDWYDAFVLPNGVVVLTMGDVSGHGLSAAASMLRLRETLRMAALSQRSPGRALGFANDALLSSGDILATALVAFVDPNYGRLTLAVAGHPAPVLIRREFAESLPVRGVVLGISETEAFDELTTLLEPGDAVACYTDGLIEGAKTPIEGERYLLDALQDAGAGQLDAIVDQILARGQLDDATIVRVSYRGPQSSWRFEVDDAGSAHSARAAFCDHLLRNGVDRETGTRAELVFGELVGNVVRHAPGPIEINLSFLDDEPVLSVRDRGPGFARHENPLPEPFAESGRGLFLVEAYAGSAPVILRRRRGGTKVVATIHPAVAAAMLSPRA